MPTASGFRHRHVLLLVTASSAAVCAYGQAAVRWDDILRQPTAWYASDDARRIAENVRRYQRASGGWPKDIDMAVMPAGPAPERPDATIDNGATTTQIRFLAHIVSTEAPDGHTYRDAVVRGIDYLLDAQYSNGGWPQYFPVRKDYSRYITFNDNAIANVLSLLEEVAQSKAPFGFVDELRRQRAAVAIYKAIPLILRAQIVVNETRTAWAAQHDDITLEPRAARAFEPAALASMESVGIVRFLLRQSKTAEITRAVDAALSWFKATELPGERWARFYEIGTNRPVFAGRDGIVRYSLDQIEKERQEGYAWYGTWPRALIRGLKGIDASGRE